MLKIEEFKKEYVKDAISIWNDIVEDGIAFPQKEALDEKSGTEFFNSQSFTGIAIDTDSNEVVGLYILHPNNVGRCGHISNASYAVKKSKRGMHIGEFLVKDCLAKAKEIARWKENVAQKWDGVQVLDLHTSDTLNANNAVNGNAYEATVKLATNGLANDLGVELVVYRNEDNQRKLKAVYPLEAVATEGDEVTYRIKNKLTDAGVFSYAFRVYPKNEALPHRQDFAYVKWI